MLRTQHALPYRLSLSLLPDLSLSTSLTLIIISLFPDWQPGPLVKPLPASRSADKKKRTKTADARSAVRQHR